MLSDNENEPLQVNENEDSKSEAQRPNGVQPRVSKISAEQQVYIDHIKVSCQEYEGLDIFQLMSINTDKGIKTRVQNIFAFVKAFLCAATQLFGIFILLIDFVSDGLEAKGIDDVSAWTDVCGANMLKHSDNAEDVAYYLNLRILSFLFSAFLAMYSIDHLNRVEKGLYHHLNSGANIKWINSLWLRLGLSINIVVSISAIYGSFVVVFFSGNSLDMILNSVALFFIVELDDMLVQKEDYRKILRYIESGAYKNVVFEEPGCCKRCLQRVSLCIGCIYTTPFMVLRYVTIASCIIIPFIVAYCY